MGGSVATGRSPAPPRFSGGNLYGLPAALVEDGPWRFLLRANGVQELYDVTRDPLERDNVVLANPELADRYRRLLEPQLAALLHTAEGASAQKPTPEQVEAMRSLGYVR